MGLRRLVWGPRRTRLLCDLLFYLHHPISLSLSGLSSDNITFSGTVTSGGPQLVPGSPILGMWQDDSLPDLSIPLLQQLEPSRAGVTPHQSSGNCGGCLDEAGVKHCHFQHEILGLFVATKKRNPSWLTPLSVGVLGRLTRLIHRKH